MLMNPFMALFLVFHTAITFTWQAIYAYTRGLWFMLTSPTQFIAFVDEWKKYAERIECQEDKVASATNRAQRRRAGF